MVEWSVWYNRLKVAFWPALAVLFFGVIVYREIWRPELPHDPGARDVAKAWSNSVGRLGIAPVFPPQEDFAVGDIWAVISHAKNDDDALLSRGIRIGRIDLRTAILANAKSLPVFADTEPLDEKKKYRAQPKTEVANGESDKISLTLAGFPGVTLSHIAKGSASLSLPFGASGADRDTEEFEDIEIPTAETYGAAPEDVFLAYLNWCKDGDNKIRCSEKYARNLLEFSVAPDVKKQTDGKNYDYDVEFQIVTRVFLAREIVHRRRVSSAKAGLAKISPDATSGANASQSSVVAADADIAARTATDANSTVQAASAASPGSSISSGAALVQSVGSEIKLSEVFQRPVAFGYRALSIQPSN
jgi:hypothetical protein